MSKYDQEYYVVIPDIIYYDGGYNSWDKHYMTFHAKDERTEDVLWQEKEQFLDRALHFSSYNNEDKKEKLKQQQLNWPGVIGDINEGTTRSEILVKKWIYDMVRPYEIDGVQFLYSIYEDCFGKYYEPLYYLNIYQFSEAWHRERSEYTQIHFEMLKAGLSSGAHLKKLSLDERVLDTIALERRLILQLSKETLDDTWILFHKSLVDKMIAHGVEGARLVRVDEWTPEHRKAIYTDKKRIRP